MQRRRSWSLNQLTRACGATLALDHVDLAAAEGNVLALLGPNGCGKTTTVRIFATLLAADIGHALVGGHDVVAEAAAVRAMIGLAGQYAAVDPFLTGRENLELVGDLRHCPPGRCRQEAGRLLERLALTEAAERLVRTYSGGMRRRLDLAAALIGSPPALFLDGPTTGLGPQSRRELWDLIGEQVASGATVLLTTQYMEEADRLAGQIAVLDRGRVIATGSPAQLKAKVGGDHLELTVPDPRQRVAARALATCAEPPSVQEPLIIRIPLAAGGGGPVSVVAELADRGVRVSDLQVHRPALEGCLPSPDRAAGPGRASPQEGAAVSTNSALQVPALLAARDTLAITAVGFAVGFRIHTAVPAALAALGLTIAFSWVMLCLALTLGTAEATQAAGQTLMFLLAFISSAFVPVTTLPGWLQAIARVNPVTYAVDALRVLLAGGRAARPVLLTVAWIAGLVLVFAPLAVRRYRRG